MFRFPKIKSIQFSFMEFGPSNPIVGSAKNKISFEQVKRYYLPRLFANENINFYPNISFNDQLDIFYDKCQAKADCRECIGFFHTQLSVPEEHELFCKQFIPAENHRLSQLERKNKTEFSRKLLVRRSERSKEKFVQDWEPFYDKMQKEIDKRKKLVIYMPEFLEYEIFYGYRHTVEFDDDRSHWRLHELWQLEHLRYCSEEKRLWPQKSLYEEKLSERLIIEDISRRIEKSSLDDNSE